MRLHVSDMSTYIMYCDKCYTSKYDIKLPGGTWADAAADAAKNGWQVEGSEVCPLCIEEAKVVGTSARKRRQL